MMNHRDMQQSAGTACTCTAAVSHRASNEWADKAAQRIGDPQDCQVTTPAVANLQHGRAVAMISHICISCILTTQAPPVARRSCLRLLAGCAFGMQKHVWSRSNTEPGESSARTWRLYCVSFLE